MTGLYLLILMLVSLFFSINLYRISTSEVSTRLRRQVDFFNSRPRPGAGFDINPLERQRQLEANNSKDHVIAQLFYANVAILGLGGVGSYLLAKRTIKPIEEAHAAQVRFTADASHELRTPIAAMRTQTEVALRDPKLTAKEARSLLKSNVEELERLTAMSDGLLQLARSKDSAVTKNDLVDIKQLVEDAIHQIMHAATAKNISIIVKEVPNISVAGHGTQLSQLLVIILDNAIKYSNAKKKITVEAGVNNNQLAISVSDQGRGIPETQLPHIFERFYRADSARSKANATGHGLGLSIAEQIAHAHDGTIEASSTPGTGSVFTIILPLTS